MQRVGQPGEVVGDGQYEGIQRAARRFLAKLACTEAEDMSVDRDAGHVFITAAEA